MYERFTDQARKVIELAEEEAERLDYEYIGTEHILLALVRDDCGVAANVLKKRDIDPDRIRTEIERLAASFPSVPAPKLSQTERKKVIEEAEEEARSLTKSESTKQILLGLPREELGAKLPRTPRVNKIFENADEEARSLNHNYVGTEHILLGLLREEHGVAAQILMNMGLTLHELREDISNPLRENTTPGKTGGPSTKSGPIDLGCDLPDMPLQALLAVLELDARMEHLTRDKEAAVAESDFEKAALLRDQRDKLKKERAEIIRQWRNVVED